MRENDRSSSSRARGALLAEDDDRPEPRPDDHLEGGEMPLVLSRNLSETDIQRKLLALERKIHRERFRVVYAEDLLYFVEEQGRMMTDYWITQCDKRDASIEFLMLKLREKEQACRVVRKNASGPVIGQSGSGAIGGSATTNPPGGGGSSSSLSSAGGASGGAAGSSPPPNSLIAAVRPKKQGWGKLFGSSGGGGNNLSEIAGGSAAAAPENAPVRPVSDDKRALAYETAFRKDRRRGKVVEGKAASGRNLPATEVADYHRDIRSEDVRAELLAQQDGRPDHTTKDPPPHESDGTTVWLADGLVAEDGPPPMTGAEEDGPSLEEVHAKYREVRNSVHEILLDSATSVHEFVQDVLEELGGDDVSPPRTGPAWELGEGDAIVGSPRSPRADEESEEDMWWQGCNVV